VCRFQVAGGRQGPERTNGATWTVVHAEPGLDGGAQVRIEGASL
jgi:hypothetical protein